MCKVTTVVIIVIDMPRAGGNLYSFPTEPRAFAVYIKPGYSHDLGYLEKMD